MVSAKVLVLVLVVAAATASPTPTIGLAATIIGGALGHDGLDHDGLDQGGLDQGGLDHDGIDQGGLDHDGLDQGGLDQGGLDHDGLDQGGLDQGGLVRQKPWVPKWRLNDKTGTKHVYVQGESPLEPFGYLAKGVTDLAGNVRDILADIVKLRFPATFDDAINAIITIARVAAGIINVVIPGLGSLLGNIVIALARILICVLGSPGLTGTVFGDRRGGYGNSKDIPAVCLKDYGHKYGSQSYNGVYDSPKDVIDYYNLRNSKSNINDLIDKATGGKGIDNLSASDRIIVELVLEFSSYLERTDNNDWSQKDIENLGAYISIMVGVIGNGYSDGYGADLIDCIFDFVEPSFNDKGLDLSCREKEIKEKIAGCKIYNFGGALRNCRDGSGEDSGGLFGTDGSSGSSWSGSSSSGSSNGGYGSSFDSSDSSDSSGSFGSSGSGSSSNTGSSRNWNESGNDGSSSGSNNSGGSGSWNLLGSSSNWNESGSSDNSSSSNSNSSSNSSSESNNSGSSSSSSGNSSSGSSSGNSGNDGNDSGSYDNNNCNDNNNNVNNKII
ncbi:uncharacterized protein DDB_G0283357-like isoform X2 [Plodia interpunctella]|uniref:uncharacterized protein DDB_G0283357-like isoform X2 n=1 Tax=Plodia interpunctella TaxID=58824 RepID=UPI002367E869|nr:uncharacterized protein DDB_G0283357-like isoform X2 [Plodia interpunctella]